MERCVVRTATAADREPIARLLEDWWSAPTIVVHGAARDASALPALVAEDADGRLVGLLTYEIAETGLEIVTLNALVRLAGIGTRLLAAAIEVARVCGLDRVWLVTTNDNLDALRFYQRRGMRLTVVEPGAVDRARLLKPEIPVVGDYAIERHDEFLLEIRLAEV